MKKIVSILLVAVLVVGASLATFAHPDILNPARNRDPENVPTIYNITNNIYGTTVYGDYMGDAAWDPEHTAPGSIIQIPLLKRGFQDENGGEIPSWSDDLEEQHLGPTVRQLKSNRVTAEFHVIKGKNFIKSIDIVEMKPTKRNPARAMIEIKFVDDVVSTKEIDYEFAVYLSLDGRMTPTEEIFGGMISNEIYDVYQIDYLYIGDGQVAHAKSGSQMDLTLDLGNGVRLNRDMFITERYYGYATLYGNEHQDPITKAYRKYINTVIDITSIDMKINGAYVTLEKELSEPSFYVYDLEGKYVGRSGDKLPYSTRYYLAVEEIEIDPALSEHPIAEGDEAKLPKALQRFLEGGRKAAGLVEEE